METSGSLWLSLGRGLLLSHMQACTCAFWVSTVTTWLSLTLVLTLTSVSSELTELFGSCEGSFFPVFVRIQAPQLWKQSCKGLDGGG